MSQDERSKSNPAVNDDHDDYDDGSIMIRPCPVRSEGTTAFSLITTEHGQPIFPLHSWCRAVPALVASKSLLESDGFKRDKWPWTCNWDDDYRRILPKPSKEVALTISSKTRERSEPIPAVFDTGASAHCFPNTAFFIQAAVPNSFTSCHVVIKTARKGEVLIATKKADFLLRGLPDNPNSSSAPGSPSRWRPARTHLRRQTDARRLQPQIRKRPVHSERPPGSQVHDSAPQPRLPLRGAQQILRQST